MSEVAGRGLLTLSCGEDAIPQPGRVPWLQNVTQADTVGGLRMRLFSRAVSGVETNQDLQDPLEIVR